MKFFSLSKTRYKAVICLVLIAALLLTCACGKKEKETVKELKVGTENITGNFNPFYAEKEGDKAVVSQIFPSLQVKSANNKFINRCGSISYEYVEGEKVKYTVTIRNDIYFSDGTNATIDDLLFWYYFISDATYDGVYKDFYLNDIEGIKEYYYDSQNYQSDIQRFNGNKKLISEYIKGNYADGISVSEISGIKRVDNYTCTILFNSRNINAVSEINAFLVSRLFYGKDYVKGSADKVKEITSSAMGCGKYFLSSFGKGEAELLTNKFCYGDLPAFRKVTFIDLAAKKKDPVESAKSGYVDIVGVTADNKTVTSLNGDKIKYVTAAEDCYCSIFFNSRSLDTEVRKMLQSACDVYSVIESEYGGNYTKVFMPLSVRFEESPDVDEAYYSQLLTAPLLSQYIKTLSAYYAGDKQDLEYKILEKFGENIQQYGVKLNITVTDAKDLNAAIKNGKAQVWIGYTDDGDTCDKYEYYHTGGSMNFTGLSDAGVDDLTERVRKATGFSDKKDLMQQLMKAVMETAVEMPLFQQRMLIIYNTSIFDQNCVNLMTSYDTIYSCISELY